MIKITDKGNGSVHFWEVLETTGNMSTINYNIDDPINNRKYVLEKIVDLYVANGYTDTKWENEEYTILTLRKDSNRRLPII